MHDCQQLLYDLTIILELYNIKSFNNLLMLQVLTESDSLKAPVKYKADRGNSYNLHGL